MTTPDLLEKVPAELREFVKKYDLSPAFVENFLLPLALSSGRVDDAAIERLQSVAARYGKDMAADALVLECQLQAGGMDQATRDRLLHLLDRQKAFTEPVVGALMEKSNKITPQLIDELEKARDAESISHVLETVK